MARTLFPGAVAAGRCGEPPAQEAGVDQYTVVVADDDDEVRAALCDTLTAEPDFLVLAAVATGEEAADAAGTYRPNLALLDVRMPGGGVELVQLIRFRSPATAVVTISAHAAAGLVADMLLAGVVGFLAKGWGEMPLIDALRRCARGEVVVAAPSGAAAISMLLQARLKH